MDGLKTAGQLFTGYKVSTVKSRRSERGDLIDVFYERMNAERKRQGYKEWTKSSVAYFLSIYTTQQLYFLRMKCENAKNFGATFNYFIFPKNGTTNK